jgi:threonine/homoserine/homoserine lactone efflux protein
MIKKLIFILVLAGLGYVGYLAWHQYLSPRDRQKIVNRLENTGRQLKDTASELAKKGAAVVKEKLDDEKKPAARAGEKGAPEK